MTTETISATVQVGAQGALCSRGEADALSVRILQETGWWIDPSHLRQRGLDMPSQLLAHTVQAAGKVCGFALYQ